MKTKATATVTAYHGESHTLWFVVSEEHETIASYQTPKEANAFASGYNTRREHEKPVLGRANETIQSFDTDEG